MTEARTIMIFGPKADGTYVIEFRTANFRRCRLHAQAVAAAQRSDCHRTGASISGVMCGVKPSNVQASVASFSGPVHGRARALMPPG
jgi:hypothetical protein